MFVLIFLGVVVLSLVFLYKAGKLSSEKMQLQNAADASAYSISVLEARDLNFIAYTNRAMISNEVAVAQFVGLASIPRHIESTGYYLEAFCNHRIAPLGNALGAVIGYSTLGNTMCKGVNVLAKFLQKAKKVVNPMDKFTGYAAAVMHGTNKFISLTQTAYHLSTMAYVVSTIQEIIDDNTADARVSPYGLTTLLSHLQTYGMMEPLMPGKMIKTYMPKKKGDAEGFKRFAAIVSESRDEFSKQRGWTLPLLDLHPRIYWTSPKINVLIAKFWIEMGLEFDLDLDLSRWGGTEIRHGKKDRGLDYTWSAGDTSGLDLFFRLYFYLYFVIDPIIGDKDYFGASAEAQTAMDRFKLNLTLKPPIIDPIDIPITGKKGVPFPTSQPFGASGVQALAAKNLTEKQLKKLPKSSPDSYGGAAGYNFAHTKAWRGGKLPVIDLPAFTPMASNHRCLGFAGPAPLPCFVPTVSKTMPRNKLWGKLPGLPKYQGLPMHRSLQDKPDDGFKGFEGPFIIMALQKDQDDLFSNTAPQPVGQFQLDEASGNGVMSVMAKSEVYFKRPLGSDLSYFARPDDYEEQGNAFNPYWSARLAPLTHADKTLAALNQSGGNFDDTPLNGLNPLSWNLLNWIP